MKYFIIVLLTFTFIIGVVNWATVSRTPAARAVQAQREREFNEKIRRAAIVTAAKNIIRENFLKSPSTAVFGEGKLTGYGPRYTVTGYVDAQNGFGAMIRNTYVATVNVYGEVVHLTDVTFD